MTETYYGAKHKFTSRTNAREVILTSNKILNINSSVTFNGSFQIIYSVDDFPESINSEITLEDNKTYIISGNIDLLGSKLICGNVTVIEGYSSESSSFTSTGLSSGALINSEHSLVLRKITIKNVPTALALNGTGTQAIDWQACNFENVPNLGTIQNYSNFVYESGAIIDCSNLVFTGTFGTIAFVNSLLTNDSGTGATIIIDEDCIITRRFKLIESSMVTTTGGTSINFSTSATIPNQGYILTSCNFSGGTATHLVNIESNDNKSLFFKNLGISNSRSTGSLYTNVSAATTTVLNTWIKLLGTTTANPLNQKFTHTNNRLTYAGTLSQIMTVSYSVSITGSPNRNFNLGISKNGQNPLESTIIQNTCDSSGASVSGSVTTFIDIDTNDYVEIWIKNITDSSSMTAVRMTLSISGQF